jgi:hypothetical protein
MKNSPSKPVLYFSAYPLKALKKATQDDSSENSSLHISSKAKATGRIRVLPMAKPYKTQIKPAPRIKPSDLKEDTGDNTKGWYGNYE